MVERLSDWVRKTLPQKLMEMSARESALAIHLRGNDALYEVLTGLIEDRISGRANLPEPSDPIACKSMLARDRELQWLLSRIEFIYRSPANNPGSDDGEQPA